MSDRQLAYRVRALPAQLEAARRKVAALENEARRYRMYDLLGEPAPASLPRDGRAI